MSDSIADFGLRIAEYSRKHRVFNPKSAIRNPQLNGFTLIEVLLALAIFSGVVTVIYSVFSTTGSTVEQAEKIRDETDTARTLINHIQNDIANAYWKSGMTDTFLYGPKPEEANLEKKQVFGSLFLTTLTNYRRPDSKEMELWEVHYEFKDTPDGNGRVLMRGEKRELSQDVPPLEGGVEYELTDQIETLRYRFTNDGVNWLDEWDTRKQNALPRAVEILLIMSGGSVYTTTVDVRNR